MSVNEIPIVDHIAPLSQSTDAWLVDIWGVIHNGVEPFQSAVAACTTFRTIGGTVILLSNAPRPGSSVVGQLDNIGVDPKAWDAIVTSGDAARVLIADWGDRPVLHIGPERDEPTFEGLDVARVAAEDAQGIVCTGLFDDVTETPEDYTDVLKDLVDRKLPMICANPDIKVERGSNIIYCAGAVAAKYEELGGRVAYAGKPHLPIYDRALKAIAEKRGARVPPARVLAIGDGVLTDIKGAAQAGIRAVYISSGVHLEDGEGLDNKALIKLFPCAEGRPLAAQTALSW